MKLADGIRKHGFRTWYERQLLQSHAHLALTFCCVVGIFAAFEASSKFHSLADQITDFAAVLISAGIGLWALRRYLFLLAHAEAVANQADCPQCGTYGRLELLSTTGADEAVAVRCRKCGHAWRINA
jgi:DNA-directed RNA polymerase subunit M/transcription elongation factor TFIIS